MITRSADLKDYNVLAISQFHLKDKPGRQLKIISLQTEFESERPEFIVIEKVKGKNNTILVKGFVKKIVTNDNLQVIQPVPGQTSKMPMRKEVLDTESEKKPVSVI